MKEHVCSSGIGNPKLMTWNGGPVNSIFLEEVRYYA